MPRWGRRRAVVVGAGVFGASVADHLAASRWDVELVEQYQPGHVRQSSGGASRLIRYSHGGDADHSRMAWRARELWERLEHDTGDRLLVRSGVVWFTRGDGWVSDSARTLADLGIPARMIDTGDVRRLFPSVAVSDLTGALYEPQAGVVRAAMAVRSLVARAIRNGARLTAAPAQPDGAGVVVGGRRRDSDVVVWACGPWMPRLFPELVRAEVTKQDVLFFGVGPEWAAPGVPGWVDFDAAMYGCGDIDGLGFKAASDIDGERFDPDRGERTPSPRAVSQAVAYLGHRFPLLSAAPIVFSRTCQYTSTPDGRWIVAPHPDHPGVWLVGGGSGHGFKHGPALAEHVGRLIEGSTDPDPRFGLGPRSVGTALRTHPGGVA